MIAPYFHHHPRIRVVFAALSMGYYGTAAAQATGPVSDDSTMGSGEPTDSDENSTATLPQVTHYVEPNWPVEALENGTEATIVFHLTIDENGVVTNAEIAESAGPGLDEAALEAALELGFSPATDETGQPVGQIIEYRYNLVQMEEGTELATDTSDTEQSLPSPLTGQVRMMGTRLPKAGVEVRITDTTGTSYSDSTDHEGRFEFTELAFGMATIEVIHYGFDRPESIEIRENETTDVRLWIRVNSNEMPEMVIRSEGPPPLEVTRRSIGVEEIRRVPGTFGDPVRVIQNLPGAARAPFGTGLLVVRGANPEDSAVSVDGIRVPLIYHLGGYVSILNSDLIDGVDYLPGGYSTRYGRSMGGVIDVRSRDEFSPNSRFTWSTDLLDSGGVFEGRIGADDEIGIAVAARRSYIDAIIPAFSRNTDFTIKPRWYDYQFKLSDLSERDHTLSFFAFGFNDVMFIQTPDDVAQGTSQTSQGNVDLSYGTHRVAVKWLKPLGEGMELLIQPSLGIDTTEFNLGDSWRFAVRQTYVILRSEFSWQISPAIRWNTGLDFIGGSFDVDFKLAYSPESLASSDPLTETDTWVSGLDIWGWSPDPWMDLQIRPFQNRDRLVLIPGIRLSTFIIGSSARLWGIDPRFQTRLQLTPSTVFKGGTGIYQQPPIGSDIGFDQDNITVGYEHAWGSEVGLEQELGLALTADITFFHKTMNNLIIENPDFPTASGEAPFVNQGEGLVQGMEIMIRRAPIDNFFGWLSYSLSKSERRDDPTDPDGWYRFDFDQTHILTGVGGWDLPRDFSISGRLQYVTGNPYTPYDTGIYDLDQDSYLGFATGNRNSERMPPYYAVDLRIDKLFTFRHWQLEAYVDFLNAVHGINPEGVRYSYDYTESTFVRGLPFIPSPGIEARFTL